MTKHTDLKMPQEYLARWALPIRALDRVGLNILARFTIRWASLERTMRWERWTNWAEVRSPWSPWRSSLLYRWACLRRNEMRIRGVGSDSDIVLNYLDSMYNNSSFRNVTPPPSTCSMRSTRHLIQCTERWATLIFILQSSSGIGQWTSCIYKICS